MHITFHKSLLTDLLARCKVIPWVLGYHAFVCIIAFALIDVTIGEYLLYKYVVSATMPEELESSVVIFKQSVYQSVLQAKQERADTLQNVLSKGFQNPFVK